MQYTQGFSNSRALSAVSNDRCKILYQPLGFSNDGYKLPFKHCYHQKLVGAIGPFSKSMGVFPPITSQMTTTLKLVYLYLPKFQEKAFLKNRKLFGSKQITSYCIVINASLWTLRSLGSMRGESWVM